MYTDKDGRKDRKPERMTIVHIDKDGRKTERRKVGTQIHKQTFRRIQSEIG